MSAMLIVVLAIADGPIMRVLSHGACCKLGAISYSLYLTHTILLCGFRHVLPGLGIMTSWIQTAITVAVSLAAAVAFWHLIESRASGFRMR
jgi:peptidoglycan/LPS O-acetylase OafA/YrhL